MEIEKNKRINALFDFYENLLTKKQMDYVADYYRNDYSLGEIAHNYNVSRQAVYDNVKRTEKILEDYEFKLKLYQDFLKRTQKMNELIKYVSINYSDDNRLTQLLRELDNLEE